MEYALLPLPVLRCSAGYSLRFKMAHPLQSISWKIHPTHPDRRCIDMNIIPTRRLIRDHLLCHWMPISWLLYAF